jgi:hypothetical protein
VKLLGENLTAEEAGKLGFLFKKTEDSSDDGDDEKDNDSDKQ